MATKQPTPEPKILQVLAYQPVVGGNNTIDATPIAAWALREDGTVVALVRDGARLVAAVVPDTED